MKVAVIGQGIVGEVLADCLSRKHTVFRAETSRERREELESRGLYVFVDARNAAKEAKAVFICVGTPSSLDGGVDLSQVSRACDQMREVSRGKLFVVCSTVPPGTTEGLVRRKLGGSGFLLANSPEFIRETRALYDQLNPSRVLIGTDDDEAERLLLSVYKGCFDNEPTYLRMKPEESELAKYLHNAFFATKVSFANEASALCSKLGLDAKAVMEAVGADPEIHRSHMLPGRPYAGKCLPKDVDGLLKFADGKGVDLSIIRAAKEVNDRWSR